MHGFHVGGYEAAKQAIRGEYENQLNNLSALLARTPLDQVAERERLEQEVSHGRQEYRAALAALERALF